jgi:hypothetical protein
MPIDSKLAKELGNELIQKYTNDDIQSVIGLDIGCCFWRRYPTAQLEDWKKIESIISHSPHILDHYPVVFQEPNESIIDYQNRCWESKWQDMIDRKVLTEDDLPALRKQHCFVSS